VRARKKKLYQQQTVWNTDSCSKTLYSSFLQAIKSYRCDRSKVS